MDDGFAQPKLVHRHRGRLRAVFSFDNPTDNMKRPQEITLGEMSAMVFAVCWFIARILSAAITSRSAGSAGWIMSGCPISIRYSPVRLAASSPPK
jgi:hypothetical protein